MAVIYHNPCITLYNPYIKWAKFNNPDHSIIFGTSINQFHPGFWNVFCPQYVCLQDCPQHYCDVIMGPMASQITSLTIVHSAVYAGADQRKHQSSASLAFVRGIHRGPVNSPHKWSVTRKMFPFNDVIMNIKQLIWEFVKYCLCLTSENHCMYPALYFIIHFTQYKRFFNWDYPISCDYEKISCNLYSL